MKIKLQQDIKDCGLYVIQALHRKYHGRWLDISTVKTKAKMSSMGMNILSLIKLGKEFGFSMEGFKVEIDSLIKRKNEDMIALVNSDGMNHFVIFNFDGENFNISDPAKGNYSLTIEEFQNIFNGIVITMVPDEYTHKEIQKDFSPYYFIFKNIHLMSWIMISLFLAVIFAFCSSLFMKLIFDFVLPGKLVSTLSIITIGFIFLAIIKSVNELFKKYLNKKLNLIIEFELIHLYFEKIKSAPLIELDKISRQDHMRRISLISLVSSFMSTGIFIVFNESIIFLSAFIIIIWISPTLFAIALLGAALAGISMFVFQYFLKDKYNEYIELQLKSFQSQVDYLFSQKELKEAKWAYHQSKVMENNIKSFKSSEMTIWRAINFQTLVDSLITIITPIVLTYASVHLIFDNKLTVGSMLLFLSIFHFFISPILSLCDFGLKLNQNLKNLSLVSYTINLPIEPLNENGLKLEEIKKIKLENVIFEYDQPLIKIKSLEVTGPIHIEGPNGSGKSTLLNIIALRQKVKGKITFNKYESEYYSLTNVRDQIFMSSPNSYIPTMSIIEYITLNNEDALQRFQINAARYNLIPILKRLNLTLETLMINNGENLSSGQRQFIMLLPLFAYDYKLILLDEALENIDLEIVSKLKQCIPKVQQGMFIEISHSRKYLTSGKAVQFEKINDNTY